ncbi:HAD family hydrolase [Paenibacillus sp. sptzw28]|uniref:HAD family hydrolase n=1 Tax=Paenibacillus sp. sptzw28 TaxID=715179 RepID=UPI001C6E009A|nr:HAD family hydrolase [Paenibacillus sp. sptzw28]QYR23513.1 HAD family hydrolase [Paenibacillus sp. sptzw28]
MKPLSHYSTWLFDLDGTLTDPMVGITKSIQYALRRFDIEVGDLNVLKPFIGPPLLGSFQEFYRFTEGQAQQAVAYYREYFVEHGMYENELYAGITDLLTLLKGQGKRLLVATSKPEVFAKKIVEHFKIDTYFEYIGGSELDGVRSDKSELIAYLVKNHNIDCSQAIMVGDRKHDVIGAVNNGIPAIGVGYGYGDEQELRGAGAAYYVPTVSALHTACIN